MQGEKFAARNPATGELIWQGNAATASEVDEAVKAARKAFPKWSRLSFNERAAYVLAFETQLRQEQNRFAELISQATGKPLWESKYEVAAMIQKIAISIAAYQERCPERALPFDQSTLVVRHKPHGIAAIFGPFNFPGHLPNGHIVPALLAGNVIVFKGSECTPTVSEFMVSLWNMLPKGVINLLQGGATTGQHLMHHPQIDALFFTGSHHTGMSILDSLRLHPEKIVALEMGGNNPLVVSEVDDLEVAAYLTVQSAFLTTGQRCTCARRLIVVESKENADFLKILIRKTKELHIGPYTQEPEPFMGPVITKESAQSLLATQAALIEQKGKCLLEIRMLKENSAFLSPGIMDVTEVMQRKDEEIFGPFLQIIRVPHFEAAIEEANSTSYGLVAGIFTRNKEQFRKFYHEVRAGVINWNTPTTGASSKAPFGGIGKSGNHRPSGYYAADYCSYPVASIESEVLAVPKILAPGVGITK